VESDVHPCIPCAGLADGHDVARERLTVREPSRATILVAMCSTAAANVARSGKVVGSGVSGVMGSASMSFAVPEITPEDWCRDHYQRPAEMMVYSAIMGQRYGWARPAERDVKCDEAGCSRKAIRFRVHCMEHDIEHGRRLGSVPPEPRLFPPYGAGR
jgi:hypothetical protein